MSWLRLKYSRLMLKHPFLMQCVQTGVLCATGDVLAQTYLDQKHLTKIDKQRTMKFFIFGAFFNAPPLVIWYRIMNRQIGAKGSSVAIKKMLVDQILWAPVACFINLMVLNYVVFRNSLDESFELTKSCYKDIIIANWKVWPMFQLCNFYFVPLNYQVIAVQSMSIFWNCYYSWRTTSVTNKNKRTQEE